MLIRFSLYGALKNQRYFEPFLLLAMLEGGLSFAAIGTLVALRELTTAVLEIPSGAIADVLGRRRSMVAAFVAYVVAYVVLGFAGNIAGFALGLALIGFGDAFRTGTHKAMIFDWLAEQGRSDDRVQVYGYTRSWSQIGSAISIPIAAATVFLFESYQYVFWMAAVPAALNVLNLATYPASLDGDHEARSARDVARHLGTSLKAVVRERPLRRLLVEAAAFGGTYKVLKDYLQPVVAALAVSLPILSSLSDDRATAATVGVVYVGLYSLSAVASRRAHHWVERFGDIERAAWWLWVVTLVAYASLAPALAVGWSGAAVAGFVVLALLHNVFRPLLVSRIDEHGDRKAGATVLSVESQGTATTAIVLAPAIGFAVDAASSALWPAAAIAAGIVALVLLAVVRRSAPASEA